MAQVRIIIELTEAGQILVNGPLEQEALMWWLLDKAKGVVEEYNKKRAQESRIVVPVLEAAMPPGREQ